MLSSLVKSPTSRYHTQAPTFRFSALPCPLGFFPTRTEISTPSSAHALDKIPSWIHACSTSHECGAFDKVNPLPTRILAIGKENEKISLVPSTGLTGRYTCLSHCWGGHQPLKMTKQTLDTFVVGIEWSGVPKTYQDAITLTRKLGIEYIWIDSLCIVQDDDVDWQRESAAMADVFANSTLTIAATSASDCDEGFFENFSHPISVRGSTASGQQLHVLASSCMPHPNLDGIRWSCSWGRVAAAWPWLGSSRKTTLPTSPSHNSERDDLGMRRVDILSMSN